MSGGSGGSGGTLLLKTKGRFRFSEDFDLHLAREVLGQNPYEDAGRWALIQVNMIQITGKCISIRTLRERVQNLIRKHTEKVRAQDQRSGIEVLVTEMDDLLQQIKDLIKEFELNKNKNKKNSSGSVMNQSYNLGLNIREQACSSLNAGYEIPTNEPDNEAIEVDTIDIEIANDESVAAIMEIPQEIPSCSTMPTPSVTRKRPLAQTNIINPVSKRKRTGLKPTTLEYLEKKNEQQFKIRWGELELQNKRQLLEENKYELEKQERINRIEMDNRRLKMEEDRCKIQLDLVRNQQEILKLVLKRD